MGRLSNDHILLRLSNDHILLTDFDLDLPEILSNSGVGQSDSKAS